MNAIDQIIDIRKQLHGYTIRRSLLREIQPSTIDSLLILAIDDYSMSGSTKKMRRITPRVKEHKEYTCAVCKARFKSFATNAKYCKKECQRAAYALAQREKYYRDKKASK